MSPQVPLANQIQRGQRLQQLHTTADSIFLMPNAWDAGSALMLASAGFAAVATTSAGVCFALGFPDEEAAVSREAMLDEVGLIARAVPLPVSADMQAGYGARPEGVAQTITGVIRAGAVGANVEDRAEGAAQPLLPIAQAAERIRAARQAADASGVPFVLTARTDMYLSGRQAGADPFAEAVKRCNAYREAGADCLFVPGATDAQTIGALVREIQGPLTVVQGLSGPSLSMAQLGALGVRRVTIGGSLARAAFGLIRRAAQEMAGPGTFDFATQQIPQTELSRFFADHRKD